MGYVKRKCSNAGKITVARFQEVQEEFLADIKAEVLMNEVHPLIIFNWDQTAIQFVLTGQWIMHRSKEKVIPIAKSDDKRQITAVLAVTMTGEYLFPQVIYQGKTLHCHPKVSFPNGWEVWHSDNHWSNEETMEQYINKIIVPFISQKRESLKLEESQVSLRWQFLIGSKDRRHPIFLLPLKSTTSSVYKYQQIVQTNCSRWMFLSTRQDEKKVPSLVRRSPETVTRQRAT